MVPNPVVPAVAQLTSEDALFWRVQCEQAQVADLLLFFFFFLESSQTPQPTAIPLTRGEQALDTADAVLPAAATLCATIEDYLGREGDAEDLEDRLQLQFVLTELLGIARIVDYADEAGRRYVAAVGIVLCAADSHAARWRRWYGGRCCRRACPRPSSARS